MGYFLEGVWHTQEVNPKTEDGAFHRFDSVFRNKIESDSDDFPAETERYHLYVSLACPWAHRTLIMRALKGLESHVGISVVHPYMGDDGWHFSDYPGSILDNVNGFRYLKEAYVMSNSKYSGRVTVPVLWDIHKSCIVNNESSEIIRFFNTEFNHLSGNGDDYYPEDLRDEIDELNDFIYHRINNGVYKVGFSRKQDVYDKEVLSLFNALEHIDDRLSSRTFLIGDHLTEADIRLFVTLVRFDFCYVVHFKCNRRMISQFSSLYSYLKRLYSIEAFHSTTDLKQCMHHYYVSHTNLNPYQIVPSGPNIAQYFS
ncbi:glutathione-dependent reductase [Candidatus Marinamargulisbacteria bacterium SCGC AG-343-D04]|nr:glutathione-dependent reductase [Candidatus Marinamargulisbacteria bacterium SCGC AG-343-D04]